MQIIASETSPGHWTAWTADAPQNGYGGPTAADAVQRLCRVIGRDPNRFRFMASESRSGQFVFHERSRGPCPDCGGSGRYVGFVVIEACRACSGSGQA